MEDSSMFPLGLLTEGERCEVVQIRIKEIISKNKKADKKDFITQIKDLGIREGKKLHMLNNGGDGSLIIKVDDSRIAIARKIAMQIIVRREE